MADVEDSVTMCLAAVAAKRSSVRACRASDWPARGLQRGEVMGITKSREPAEGARCVTVAIKIEIDLQTKRA